MSNANSDANTHPLETELHGALLRVYVHGETGGSVLVGIDVEWERDSDVCAVYGDVAGFVAGSPVVECCEGMTHAELLALVPGEDWLLSEFEGLGGISAKRAVDRDAAFARDADDCPGGLTQSGLVMLGWACEIT